MPLKVLIVPDKFKGTLTATAAAEAMAAGWRKSRPTDSLELFPMSDGGDGFGELLGARLNARPQWIDSVDAAHRRLRAKWWRVAKTGTAIIESANIIGLARLPAGKFHPFDLDTYGLGAAIRAAAARGARHCIVGIGGSATNDGGFGLARSLGWKFLDRSGNVISAWTQLDAAVKLHPPDKNRRFDSLTVAVDVQNPLLGARGCTRIYGPQKGLRPSDFAKAERCLRVLARLGAHQLGRDYSSEPGAGAAGGLGFGLATFLGAQLEPGFDVFARHCNLLKRLRNANLVLTGEGAIDRQTLMGKGVGQLGKLCLEQSIPCIALAGTVNAHGTRRCFTATHALTDLTTIEEAKTNPGFWLRRLTAQIAAKWSAKPDQTIVTIATNRAER